MPKVENAPASMQKRLEDVYNEYRNKGFSKARASKAAWGAVKMSYEKVGGKWRKK